MRNIIALLSPIEGTEPDRNVVYIVEPLTTDESKELFYYLEGNPNNLIILRDADHVIVRRKDAEGEKLKEVEKGEYGAPIEFAVGNVVSDYGVFKNGKLMPELICNSRTNALLIAHILKEDSRNHRVEKTSIRLYTR